MDTSCLEKGLVHASHDQTEHDPTQLLIVQVSTTVYYSPNKKQYHIQMCLRVHATVQSNLIHTNITPTQSACMLIFVTSHTFMHTDSAMIQLKFSPTDHCIKWTVREKLLLCLM